MSASNAQPPASSAHSPSGEFAHGRRRRVCVFGERWQAPFCTKETGERRKPTFCSVRPSSASASTGRSPVLRGIQVKLRPLFSEEVSCFAVTVPHLQSHEGQRRQWRTAREQPRPRDGRGQEHRTGENTRPHALLQNDWIPVSSHLHCEA